MGDAHLPSATGHDGHVADVQLTHPSGVVVLREVEGRITADMLQLCGVVDRLEWGHIERHDIVGAATRTRSPGVLPGSGPVHITIVTDQVLPEQSSVLPAGAFAIIDAMCAVDPAELQAAGLEGEVWEGIRFSDPPAWSGAVTELLADGFEMVTADEQSALLRSGDALATVEFRYRDDVRLVQMVVSSALGVGDDAPMALYEAINGINMVVPWSTTMIDHGDVLVRESVADATVHQGAVITLRTQEMLGLLWVMRGPLAEVAQGRLTPEAGLEVMFS